MYAVMFYVILNKRKLHFPLAKNVMHSPSINHDNRRFLRLSSVGSLPLAKNALLVDIIGERWHDFYIYPALMYAVMFYVTLNKRKRLGDCVTFSYLSGRALHIP